MRFPFFRISLFFPSRMHVYIYRKCQEWEYSSPGSDNSSTNLTRACACISIGEPRKFAGEGLLFFSFFLVVWSSTRGLMSDDVVLDIHTGICRSGYIYMVSGVSEGRAPTVRQEIFIGVSLGFFFTFVKMKVRVVLYIHSRRSQIWRSLRETL